MNPEETPEVIEEPADPPADQPTEPQKVEVTNEKPIDVEVKNGEEPVKVEVQNGELPQNVEVKNGEEPIITKMSDEQFAELKKLIEANKPYEPSTATEATISQEQMDHFTTMYNDMKTSNYMFLTIAVALVLGYVAIKGLLSNWKV